MKKIPLIIILIITVTAILLPVITEASNQNRLVAAVQLPEEYRPQYAVNIPVATYENPAQTGNIILQLIAGSLIYVAGPLAVLMIAIGGFRYVIAHGEQSQIEEAKKNIVWAIIGLLVIIVSYAIVSNVITISTPKEGVPASAPAAPAAQQGQEEEPQQGGESPES